MRGPPSLSLACLALAVLFGPPVEAWYKQAAGPSYYSVGRASGLLSGVRRSPYMRRSDDSSSSAPDSSAEGAPAGLASFLMAESRQNNPSTGLRNMAVCLKEVAPELQSCQLLPGVPSVIQCKADVTVSLDPADCTTP